MHQTHRLERLASPLRSLTFSTKLTPADAMQVKMKYRLVCVSSCVGGETKATLGHSFLARQLGRDGEQPSRYRGVVVGQVECARDVLVGYHKEMHGTEIVLRMARYIHGIYEIVAMEQVECNVAVAYAAQDAGTGHVNSGRFLFTFASCHS